MSASDDSNQANDVYLGSLAQYDSQDLAELVHKITHNKPVTSEEAQKYAILQSLSKQHDTQYTPNTVNLQQLAAVATQDQQHRSDEPWLEIVEQPKSKGIRFRYKCEGRSAGSIPGESSSNEHKTFPSVRINNFKGPAAIVVVSCVTKDEPYRPHPHTLVGKECRKGVCTVKLKRSNLATFPNLGIQCVTKKEIQDSLKEREQIRVDPFGTGYYEALSKLHLNIVRLCFQAFLPDETGEYKKIVTPVVSHCIYDKKAVQDLVICRLSKQSGNAKGGDEVFMLCEKVNKDDIQVRFFEEVDDETIWESYADFSQSDVHRQFAIVFKTPQYKDQSINRPVEVQIQLFRPSDEGMSEPKVFQYIPNDPDPEGLEKKRKRKLNLNSFMIDGNHPNTPAFNLLTDSIKEEPSSVKNSDLIRERLKAKASRGRKKPESTALRFPQYTQMSAMDPPISFQSSASQMTAGEVIIQTTGLEDPQRYQTVESTAIALTALGNQPPISSSSQQLGLTSHIGNHSAHEEDDVMLADLPVGRMINDQLERQETADDQMSLPSLTNLQSFDMEQELTREMVKDSKLHMDSEPKEIKTESSPDSKEKTVYFSKMTTRGKKIQTPKT